MKGTKTWHPIRVLTKSLALSVGIFLGSLSSNANANPIFIAPNDDGTIYSSGAVINFLSLSTGPFGARAVVEFPTGAITNPISQAYLAVNPYALPLMSPIVAVYGYESNDGVLTSADYDAGTLLGGWALPPLLFHQNAFFDVTAFLQTVSSPYVGFNLHADNVNNFSSLENHYDHPSVLVVFLAVPEPGSLSLMLAALTLLGFAARARLGGRRPSRG